MPIFIDQIHDEHKNIAKVLFILERQINEFDAGRNPDFNLIRDIINYMIDYPNQVHHPKEEIMLEWLLKKNPENAEIVEQFQKEHKNLDELSQQFSEFIEDILAECVFPREQISTTAHEFIQSNQKHMDMEETILLPLALKTFTDEDWQTILAETPIKEDPLFGKQIDNRYQALFEQITLSQKT